MHTDKYAYIVIILCINKYLSCVQCVIVFEIHVLCPAHSAKKMLISIRYLSDIYKISVRYLSDSIRFVGVADQLLLTTYNCNSRKEGETRFNSCQIHGLWSQGLHTHQVVTTYDGMNLHLLISFMAQF